MINIIHIGEPRTTYGVWNIIQAVQDHSDDLLSMIKITKPKDAYTNDHAWIALFREPGTVGQFTALVNFWGTNSGRSRSGTGGHAFLEVMSLIEDNEIKLVDWSWNSFDTVVQDYLQDFKNRPTCYEILSTEIEKSLDSILPSNSNYPLNDNWSNLTQ